jgi:hypothetical protein
MADLGDVNTVRDLQLIKQFRIGSSVRDRFELLF